jgi:TRAP-type C4-dicarboxylate transport system permease small subunit
MPDMALTPTPPKSHTAEAGAPNTEAPDFFSVPLDWRRWWTILPETIALTCAGVLPVVMVVNVVSRYTDWFRLVWAEDVAKVLFLWLVFLGGAIAVKYDAHVRMTILVERLGRGSRAWMAIVRASPLVVGVILLVLGIPLVDISMRRELPSLEIPAGYFMTIVPASGLLMIVYVVKGMLAGLRRGSSPSEAA